MNKIKNSLRHLIKKNTVILKWIFALSVIAALVIVPVLSAFLSI